MSEQAQTVDEMVEQYQAEIDIKAEEPSTDVEEAKDDTAEELETEAVEESESEVEVQDDESEEEVAEDDSEAEAVQDEPAGEWQEKLENLEVKIKRQTAAYAQLQRTLETERAERLQAAEPELVKPSLDAFDSIEAYEKAVDDYIEKKSETAAGSKATEQMEQARYQEQNEARRADFNTKQADVMANHADYNEAADVVQQYLSLADPNHPSVKMFRDSILESDNAPALIYHLGKNEAKIEALMNKPPVAVAKMVAGYEQELKAQTVAPVKKVKPRPPKTVKATGKGKKDLSQMSGREIIDSQGL